MLVVELGFERAPELIDHSDEVVLLARASALGEELRDLVDRLRSFFSDIVVDLVTDIAAVFQEERCHGGVTRKLFR